VFALIIVGAIIAAVGKFNEKDNVAEVGFWLMGIGVFIIIILTILSYKDRKNYITG